MKDIIYQLSTCNTCQRILKEIVPHNDVTIQDIKKQHISNEELEEIRSNVDSYDTLLNKRARLYRSMKIKEKNLSEGELKDLILQEYTLLKRPLAVIDGKIYAGNSKSTVAELKAALRK